MDFTSLPPELQTFLTSTASGALGQLSADLATRLIGAAGRSVRNQFGDEQTDALRTVTAAAILAAVKDTRVLPAEYERVWQSTGEWLLEPIVLGEFRKLLAPTPDLTLETDTLHEEFIAAGLAVDDLGKPDFDALLQDMVGAFYLVAAAEPLLQEPLKIGVLRQVAEEMGALVRLQQQEVSLSRRSLGQLEQLNLMADAVVDGQETAVALLRAILEVLENLPEDLSSRQLGYQRTFSVLSRAELNELISTGDTIELGNVTGSRNTIVGSDNTIYDGASPEFQALGEQLKEYLAQIAASLTTRDGAPSDAELAELEQNYRQALIDQFEMLTFRGITPSGKALALRLEEIYVELRTVAEVPEAADTYSADERRMMLEMEDRLDDAEVTAHLDTLRLERWRAEARRERREEIRRRERRSISETLADTSRTGLVILGDPGAGKSTLLHYLALTHARLSNQSNRGEALPIFVPLAAYDDYRARVIAPRAA